MIVEKYLDLPKPMTAEDRKRFEKFDATEEIWNVIKKLSEERPHRKTEIEWNAPRRPFVLHPSSVDNSCDFFLYLQMVGESNHSMYPPNTHAIFDTGTVIHCQYQHYMKEMARLNKFKFREEVGFNPNTNNNCEALKMAGHIDGVSELWPLKDAPLVWEFKTINKNSFDRLTSPHSGYVKQVHLYMLAVGAPAAVILYICKDNSQLNAFKVPFDYDAHNGLFERLLTIRKQARELKDPERKISVGCKRCKFTKECDPDLSGLKTKRRLPRSF